jgi:hypothetical protein
MAGTRQECLPSGRRRSRLIDVEVHFPDAVLGARRPGDVPVARFLGGIDLYRLVWNRRGFLKAMYRTTMADLSLRTNRPLTNGVKHSIPLRPPFATITTVARNDLIHTANSIASAAISSRSCRRAVVNRIKTTRSARSHPVVSEPCKSGARCCWRSTCSEMSSGYWKTTRRPAISSCSRPRRSDRLTASSSSVK